jgi:hypothetical protein
MKSSVASRLLRWCSPHKAAHGVGHDQHFGDSPGVNVDEIELVHPFTGVDVGGLRQVRAVLLSEHDRDVVGSSVPVDG